MHLCHNNDLTDACNEAFHYIVMLLIMKIDKTSLTPAKRLDLSMISRGCWHLYIFKTSSQISYK